MYGWPQFSVNTRFQAGALHIELDHRPSKHINEQTFWWVTHAVMSWSMGFSHCESYREQLKTVEIGSEMKKYIYKNSKNRYVSLKKLPNWLYS